VPSIHQAGTSQRFGTRRTQPPTAASVVQPNIAQDQRLLLKSEMPIFCVDICRQISIKGLWCYRAMQIGRFNADNSSG
jgi:hypothetical protein